MNSKIKRAIRQFIAGLLEEWGSSGMCYAACMALQGYLSAAYKLETKMVRGEIPVETGIYGGKTAEHYWLELTDGTIIDPTADQFNPEGYKMPKIYIGERPKHYKVKVWKDSLLGRMMPKILESAKASPHRRDKNGA